MNKDELRLQRDRLKDEFVEFIKHPGAELRAIESDFTRGFDAASDILLKEIKAQSDIISKMIPALVIALEDTCDKYYENVLNEVTELKKKAGLYE